jgi:hypothetical protein
MTLEITPFDHRPDPVLGAALREALTEADTGSFAARVLAQIGTARSVPSSWTVLASWARAGIFGAAAAVALLAGLLLSRDRITPVSLDDLVASQARAESRTLARAIDSPASLDPSIVLSPYEDP